MFFIPHDVSLGYTGLTCNRVERAKMGRSENGWNREVTGSPWIQITNYSLYKLCIYIFICVYNYQLLTTIKLITVYINSPLHQTCYII